MATSASSPSVISSNHHQNLRSVFVYGSLLADDVVKALLNRVPQNSAAILDNFKRFSIKGRVYPAIRPVENTKVTGRVLLDITDSELDILDIFEDEEYERSTVDVSLIDTSKKVRSYTYVWVNKNDPNLYGEWNFEEWEQLHKNGFLKMTSGFVEELEGPESKPRVATYESFYQNAKD
ncbi:AIG2-like protein D [Papaver somniferum]|uniref:AIG2-like protein D n=1 Tax=Papaver somniferum TaxID=3469 RepID=UPI000E6F5537|nr:AIG2-like protein D [Papaver somniferum]